MTFRGNEKCHIHILRLQAMPPQQEHKLIEHAGPERDMILHLHVTACRQRAGQPSSRRAISLGSFTGVEDYVFQLIHLKRLENKLQAS